MSQNAVSGFRATGLVPFNRKAIRPDQFVMEDDPIEEDEPQRPLTPVSGSQSSRSGGLPSAEDIYKAGYFDGQRRMSQRV